MNNYTILSKNKFVINAKIENIKERMGIIVSMKKKIILTGGGTAGHIMPLLALLPKLTAKYEVHYIGRSEGMEKELTAGENVIYHSVDCPRLTRGKIFVNLTLPFKLISAYFKARKVIKQIKPSLILSKGGYVSLPAVLAHGKTPVILHESDTSLGLANRVAAKCATAVCSSFPLPPVGRKSVLHTGSPLRSAIYRGNKERAAEKCGFDGSKKVLLVTGGSLGAKALNDAVDENLERLTAEFDIVHIRGRGNTAQPRKGYYPIEFTADIFDLFALADLALTRGGGNSLFELGALGKPMLIVPLPKGASRGDQIENAEFFRKHGLALVLAQTELGKLCEKLSELKNRADEFSAVLKGYRFDGTEELLSLIDKLACDEELLAAVSKKTAEE